jgi:hypothetical protein
MFNVLYHDRSYVRKKHARVASHADTGMCCVELTMHEDIAAQVENSFVQCETLATVEGCCICRSQGEIGGGGRSNLYVEG